MDYQQIVTPITAYSKPPTAVGANKIKGHVAYYETIFGLRPRAYKAGQEDSAATVSQSRPVDDYDDDDDDSDAPSTCSCSASESHECKSETVARVVGLPHHGRARISKLGDDYVVKHTEWISHTDQPIEPTFHDSEQACHHNTVCHHNPAKVLQVQRARAPVDRVYMDPKILASPSSKPRPVLPFVPRQMQKVDDVAQVQAVEYEEELVSDEVNSTREAEVEEEVVDAEPEPEEEEEEEEGAVDEEAEDDEEDVDEEEEGGTVLFRDGAEPTIAEEVAGEALYDDLDGEEEFEWAPIESVDMVRSIQASRECNSEKAELHVGPQPAPEADYLIVESAGRSSSSADRRKRSQDSERYNERKISAPGDQWIVLPIGQAGHTHRIRFS